MSNPDNDYFIKVLDVLGQEKGVIVLSDQILGHKLPSHWPRR